MMNKILFSKKSDNWGTPKFLIDFFKPTFDPCPLNSKKDGLKINWHGRILLNPPFSKQKDFVIKAISEIKNCDYLVLLLPARTDTILFHQYLYGKYRIEFLLGRLKFSNSNNSAPFPSMLIYLKENKSDFGAI